MHSKYFNLNSARDNQQKSKGKLTKVLVGSLVVVGTVAATMLLLNQNQSVNAPNFDINFLQDGAHTETQEAFIKFVAEYGKTYATKSHLNSRYETFAKNFEMIKSHNKNDDKHYEMGVNKFTDMTPEEFLEHYHKHGVQIPSEEKRLAHAHHQNRHPSLQAIALDDNQQAPEKVDWREAGKVSEPGDQSSCGSCWAFTTATTMESLHAIKNDTEPVRFSVQYLIDCDESNFGCGGGWMLDAYEFTRTKGLLKEDDYPRKYTISKNKCAEVKDKERFYNHDQKEEDNITNDRMKKLVSIRPVGVAMHSNPRCLMSYKNGILREEDCNCSDEKNQVNHAVTIVGYGNADESKDCAGYWLVKNSWGPRWGDAGFFKLCIPHEDRDRQLKTGTCQVKSYVQYPILH